MNAKELNRREAFSHRCSDVSAEDMPQAPVWVDRACKRIYRINKAAVGALIIAIGCYVAAVIWEVCK
jgi:hypothetical protein